MSFTQYALHCYDTGRHRLCPRCGRPVETFCSAQHADTPDHVRAMMALYPDLALNRNRHQAPLSWALTACWCDSCELFIMDFYSYGLALCAPDRAALIEAVLAGSVSVGDLEAALWPMLLEESAKMEAEKSAAES